MPVPLGDKTTIPSVVADISGAAPLNSPTFTGIVTFPATGTALGTPTSGTLTNCTFPTLNQSTTGNAATATATSGLSYATGTVVVSGASTPLTGQTLTITGVNTAAWQTPVSGFANPMTTLGDIIFENSTPAPARLAGNTSATKNFLTQTGNGTISAAPTWGALASGDIPNNAANTTGTSGGLTGTPSITVNALSATTINGAAFSGAFTGAPTFSGNIAFTGTPTFSNALALGSSTATTQAVSTNNTTLATTAFVVGQAATVASPMDGTSTIGVSLTYARQDHIHASDTSRAPLASPTFTGTVGAAAITATGTIQGATLTSTGALNAGTSKFVVNSSGLATTYNNITLTGNGIPSEVGIVTTGTSSAAITATNLLAAPVAAGFYRISAYLKITVATTSPVAGAITITYADKDAVAQSVVMQCQNAAGAVATQTGSTVTTPITGHLVIWCNSGTAIKYAIAFSGTGTFEYNFKVEAL